MKNETVQSDVKLYTRDQLLAYHRDMLRIRFAEERIGELVTERKIICPAHLSIGQEAVAVGVSSALQDKDYIFSTHRSHGHYLAKGGDLRAMMAELFGREPGCSGGRGGSMHLVQPEIGILGTTSIVGGCIPIAVGAGLASSMRDDGAVSVAYFGDGAMDEGVFFESINFAKLRKLPVVFICEHNYYATHMRICRRIPCSKEEGKRGQELCDCDQLTRRADLFHVPAMCVDGNDVLTVAKAAKEAVEHARGGRGPYFLECKTYRWRGHVGPNWDVDMGLRSQTEIDAWMKRCPINRIEAQMESAYGLNSEERSVIYNSARSEVEAAIDYGMSSPYPSPQTIMNHVYR